MSFSYIKGKQKKKQEKKNTEGFGYLHDLGVRDFFKNTIPYFNNFISSFSILVLLKEAPTGTNIKLSSLVISGFTEKK